MKVVAWWLLSFLLIAGCGVEQPTERAAGSSFSSVYLTSDAQFAAGTNLCVVLDDRPAGGAESLDSLVVEYAQVALLEARKVTMPFRKVVFIVKDRSNSRYGVSAGFTVYELETIVKDAKEGKKFDSLQAWPSSQLPAKQ